MRSKLWSVVLVALFALGAVACSDDSSSGSSSDDGTDTTEAAADDGSGDGDAGSGDAGSGGSGDGPVPMGSPINLDATEDLNLAEIAAGLSETQTLTRLVLQAGLLATVRDGGPFTVFAPVESAFAAVDPATLLSLSQDQVQLTEVLTLHVVPGTLTMEQLQAADGTFLTTVQGGELLVEVDGDEVTVGGAPIVAPDIPATNGMIHAIGSVITAPSR